MYGYDVEGRDRAHGHANHGYEETVYSDGSGSCGLYEVYGRKFSGIHNGESVTVTPLGIGSGHRSGRSKGTVRSTVKLLAGYIEGINGVGR